VHEQGRGTAQNDVKAAKWYRKAAELGDSRAMNNLGFMYANGRGVKQDYEEAVKWYRRAALQGDAEAQNNMGVSYEEGKGLEKNSIRALKWFLLASWGGNETALKNVEKCKQEIKPDILSAVVKATKSFRQKPVQTGSSEDQQWLHQYRLDYKNGQTWLQSYMFVVAYEDDDPDLLVPKAMTRTVALAKKEDEQQVAIERKYLTNFRSSLMLGTDTHCGMVIEVKKPLVKVQTSIGEKWFRSNQMFPPGGGACNFSNGLYQNPKSND
jgi:TPR repeat protein